MHVSKTLAVIIGLITCWPIVYFVSFIAFMFSTVMWKQTEPFEASFDVFFVAHLLTMVVIIGLLAFYIAHLFRNESMPGDRRVLWAIVLFMGNVFACPVYWYLYIWTRPPNSRLGADVMVSGLWQSMRAFLWRICRQLQRDVEAEQNRWR